MTLPFNLRRLPHHEAARRGGRLVNGHPGNEILVLNIRKSFLSARTGHRQNTFLLRSKPTGTKCVQGRHNDLSTPNTEVLDSGSDKGEAHRSVRLKHRPLETSAPPATPPPLTPDLVRPLGACM